VRLKRLQGQLGGVVRMVEQGRDCEAVIQQLVAVRNGVDRVGVRLMSTQLERCLSEPSEAPGFDRERFERLFLLLS
jgi:DNA-binding FrmR family transcriptional regulator